MFRSLQQGGMPAASTRAVAPATPERRSERGPRFPFGRGRAPLLSSIAPRVRVVRGRAPTPRAIATTVHSMGSRLFSCVQPLALLHERSTPLRDLPRDPHQNPQDTVKCSTSGPFHLMVRVLMRGERSPPHAKTRRTRRGLCRPATELRGFAPFA